MGFPLMLCEQVVVESVWDHANVGIEFLKRGCESGRGRRHDVSQVERCSTMTDVVVNRVYVEIHVALWNIEHEVI